MKDVSNFKLALFTIAISDASPLIDSKASLTTLIPTSKEPLSEGELGGHKTKE